MKLKKELWKCIPGYSKYIASNEGRIMKLPELAKNPSNTVTGKTDGRNGLILSPRPTPPQGHLQVHLIDDFGQSKMEYVHRLVALAFLKKRPGKEIVLHLDDNPQNNNLKNLRWGTHFMNSSMIKVRNVAKTRSKLESTYIKVNTMYLTNKETYSGKSKDLVALIAKEFDITTWYVYSLIYNKEYKAKFGKIKI